MASDGSEKDRKEVKRNSRGRERERKKRGSASSSSDSSRSVQTMGINVIPDN